MDSGRVITSFLYIHTLRDVNKASAANDVELFYNFRHVCREEANNETNTQTESAAWLKATHEKLMSEQHAGSMKNNTARSLTLTHNH